MVIFYFLYEYCFVVIGIYVLDNLYIELMFFNIIVMYWNVDSLRGLLVRYCCY